MLITIEKSLKKVELNVILSLLADQWWSKGRTYDDLEKILDHTDLIYVIRCPDTNTVVGFARVLTDYYYVATIYDVVIASEHQHKGVGKQLIQYILSCSELSKIHHIDLSCKNNVLDFYKDLGFETLDKSLNFLRFYSESSSYK